MCNAVEDVTCAV